MDTIGAWELGKTAFAGRPDQFVANEFDGDLNRNMDIRYSA